MVNWWRKTARNPSVERSSEHRLSGITGTRRENLSHWVWRNTSNWYGLPKIHKKKR